MSREYDCRCRKCGVEWHFGDEDLGNNSRYGIASGLGSVAAFVSANKGQAFSSAFDSSIANRWAGSVVNYARCPKCGSINVAVDVKQF